MEVIVNEKKSEEKKYPYLGIFPDNTIVFMVSDGVGLCLNKGFNSLDQVGDYSCTWIESACKKFEGEIILRNS